MVYRFGDRSVVHPSQRRELMYPPSSVRLTISKFYCDEHSNIGENYARFAFCKDVDILRQAAERLQKLVKYLS